MAKLARLVGYFCFCLIILFLVSTGIRFLAIRLEWAQLLPGQPKSLQNELTAAARWGLSLGLYSSMILGLCFISREKASALPAILCVVLLAVGFVFGVSLGLENPLSIPVENMQMQSIGGPGLILSNPARPTGTVIVLLDGPSRPDGARVVAIPDRPMFYSVSFSGRDSPSAILSSAPFGGDSPWFFKSLAIDLRLSAENLQRQYSKGQMSFLVYVGALVVLLSSFLFIMNFSAWPLANFFLCCLVFRGVLSLEILLNSPEMQDFFNSLLENYLPISAVVPMIFYSVGLLAYLYTFLVYLARRKTVDES